MYKTIIEFSKNITNSRALELTEIANRAFDNRAGKVKNTSGESHLLVYDGEEKDYGCIHLGILDLHDIEEFREQVEKWDYIDEDNPRECCDVLKELDFEVVI